MSTARCMTYTGDYTLANADADTAAFEAWLDGRCGENPSTQWLSY